MDRIEPNAEIRTVLLAVQKQLRDAVASGRKGMVRIDPVPFSDKHLWDWDSPSVSYRMKLNLTGSASKG